MNTRIAALFLFGISRSALAENPEPALLQAIFDDAPESVQKLLSEDKADPNLKNRYGVTPLSVACQTGNAEIVELLLKAGANPNESLKGGETPLMTAARTGKVGPVKQLLDHKAEIDATDRKGQTALLWAAADGHAEVVELLIEFGADPNKQLKSHFTPMLFAARNGHIDVVKSLLKTGDVDVNAVTRVSKGGKSAPPGTGALRIAIENGHFDLAVVLLEAGADPNDQRSKRTPLHTLTHVRKPNRGDSNDGAPPPEGSGTMTSLEFARVLIEKFGANPNERIKNGNGGTHRLGTDGATPFLFASKTADLPYLKLLLELGADPSIPNKDETVPILAAAGLGTHAPTEEAGTEEECLETVAWLLEIGADINAKNKHGDTVMHGAAYKSLPQMVAFLADNGADITIWNVKNRRGQTPLLIAQGFRPGNFKPAPAMRAAIESVMRAAGIEPPAAPPRPAVGKKKDYVK